MSLGARLQVLTAAARLCTLKAIPFLEKKLEEAARLGKDHLEVDITGLIDTEADIAMLAAWAHYNGLEFDFVEQRVQPATDWFQEVVSLIYRLSWAKKKE